MGIDQPSTSLNDGKGGKNKFPFKRNIFVENNMLVLVFVVVVPKLFDNIEELSFTVQVRHGS